MSRAAVVGLGLIGGSLALALEARGYDRDAGVRARARERGIDAADTLEEALAGADVVITAIATQETPALLRTIAELTPGALLTDTASLKTPIVEAAAALPTSARFVAGHPMAGARHHGVDASRPDLFRDRPWVLVHTARSDEASVAAITDLVRSVGARPVLFDARRHDRLMTWVSHLPHAVAAALTRAAQRGGGPEISELAGPGYMDTTRLAGQRVSLALELAAADPEGLASAIDAVSAELAELAAALRRGDAAALRAFFEQAGAARGEP